MNNTWKREYTLRAGDFDKYNRIKPSAVLDLFQDAAGQHAEQIGVGFNDMLSRSYLWVLTRVKFEIISAPNRYDTVLVKTWPLVPHRLNYRREYCIEDQNGNKLIIGSSEWVVIDSNERRLLSVPDLYCFDGGFRDEMMFDGKLTRVRDFDAVGVPYVVNAGFSELDVNDHVNNTKYADFVLDAINPEQEAIPQSFQIDYRKEVTQGTQLNIYFTKDGNTITSKGENSCGDAMFFCKIELKNN